MGTDLSVPWNIEIQENDGAFVVQPDAPFRSLKLTWSVENQGGGSCEVGLADTMVTTDWSQPKRIVVTGERGWAGSLTQVARSGPPAQVGRTGKAGWTASGLGLYQRLDWRIVRHIFEVNSPLDVIVGNLLDECQVNQFNGDMGLSLGTVVGSLPIRRRAYCFAVKIGDAIRELAAIGFDWEIDSNGELNIWDNTRGVYTGRTLTQSDCQGFDLSFDTAEMLTTETALADPSDPFGPRHDMARTALADDYGRKEDVIETDIIADFDKNPNWQEELIKAADGVLRTNGGGHFNLRTTWPSKNAPWSLTDVWLQDRINVDLSGTVAANVIPSPLRARLTDVTVTLETMPSRGALAPVYWVECNWDGLVEEVDVIPGDPDFEAPIEQLSAARTSVALTATPTHVDSPTDFPYDTQTPMTTPSGS